MSPAAAITLTPEQREDVLTVIEFVPPHILSRAAELVRGRAVRSLKWSWDGSTLEAQVQGGKLYKTRLEFDPESEERIFLVCSCAYGEDCKHAVAVLLELRKHAATAPAMSAGPASSPAKKKSAKPALPPPRPGSLAALVSERLGKPLNAQDRYFLETVEPWWVGKVAAVEMASLHQALGRRADWNYRQVSLFHPKLPPATVWEFLAYLAAAIDRAELRWPEAVRPVVDPSLQKNLLDQWQRQKQISEWQQTLGSWKEPETNLAGAAPELRLQLHAAGATVQIRQPGAAEFGKVSVATLRELAEKPGHHRKPGAELSAGSHLVLRAVSDDYGHVESPNAKAISPNLNQSLARLLSSRELFQQHVVDPQGEPLVIHEAPLRWELKPPAEPSGDYELRLVNEDNLSPSVPVAILPARPVRYVTVDSVHAIPYWPFGSTQVEWPVRIPAPALESREGVNALAKLGAAVPPRLAGKVRLIRASIAVSCALHRTGSSDYLQVRANATFDGHEDPSYWNGNAWIRRQPFFYLQKNVKAKAAAHEWVQVDRSAMAAAEAWLRQMPLNQFAAGYDETLLQMRITGRDFPDQFLTWLDHRPEQVTAELDPELAALREGHVAGHVRLDIEESKTGIDWFDLSLVLEVTDHSLTPEEIELLMNAKGRWVRLTGKGWRKLDLQLTEQQAQELAEMGLAADDFTGEKQRLHALQLAGPAGKAGTLLPADRAEQVRRRMSEIRTSVTPELPDTIRATLRPYQIEGFHFLAYLSANRFGGVLADDMGLGKTLQALAWLAWLRAEQKVKEPFLVVCPKSVQDNWRAEAVRFFPTLRVEVWNRATAGKTGLAGDTDLLVIHYAQLRMHEELLRPRKWGAVILDEAQAIKNPASQSARSACALEGRHRLALTGTPVENRLLDLWSIFAFAMPGVLGTRAGFTRQFDGKEDPLARRRLAARTRPFLLRRTKKEVARDLPDRIEEDLVIELDGTQAALYQAELKRARAQLLKAEVGGQLDKLRFNILTSLLRLRQICCHPKLIGLEDPALKGPARQLKSKGAEPAGSAKVTALMDILEPLMAEGQKVLVFSQFVEMLQIIETTIAEQGWPSFKLTGQTEDRGTLVSEFQEHEGAAIFLISLKAGGFGLNLTAASYVVLFDPWWNPAVEAQAIDRTHRIGQKQTVFAYRLLVKDSIEEKIRLLQKQKGELAQDILGEENFAQALTLSDFQFLLGEK